MGIFTTITFMEKCLSCGNNINEWQTKDLVIDGIYPILNITRSYELNNRMDAEVCGSCEKCGTPMELIVQKGKISEINDKKVAKSNAI